MIRSTALSKDGRRRSAEPCLADRAWDLGEEKDKEVQKFPLNRGDDKPRRCEQHFQPVPFRINFAQKLAIVTRCNYLRSNWLVLRSNAS